MNEFRATEQTDGQTCSHRCTDGQTNNYGENPEVRGVVNKHFFRNLIFDKKAHM